MPVPPSIVSKLAEISVGDRVRVETEDGFEFVGGVVGTHVRLVPTVHDCPQLHVSVEADDDIVELYGMVTHSVHVDGWRIDGEWEIDVGIQRDPNDRYRWYETGPVTRVEVVD